MNGSLARLTPWWATTAMLFSACVVGPNYQPPENKVANTWQISPEAWPVQLKLVEAAPKYSAKDWWQQWDDALLNDLMRQAIANNYDIKVATANISRAKALRDVASSGNSPTLDANLSAGRNRFSSQSNFGSSAFTRNHFNASLDASWEPDFFGKTARAVEAADASMGSAQAMRHAIELSVVAEVASNYFEVLGLAAQIQSTQQNVQLLTTLQGIVQAQVDAGVASASELARAQLERDTVLATLPAMQAEKTARAYRIAVLTGQPPEYHLAAFEHIQPFSLQRVLTDPVPMGLRSDLLRRRPDVVLAERELALASANIGIAEGDKFPSFSLTGAVGSSARVFSDWFAANTLTSSLSAALGWPLYAGALNARIEAAEANHQAALAAYQQSVLLALEDAESALLHYGSAWQQYLSLQRATGSSMQLLDVVQSRYDAGLDDFATLLAAKRTTIQSKASLFAAQTNILVRLSTLYKALGGEWSTPPL